MRRRVEERQIKIIADGPVLDSLTRWLGGTELLADWTTGSETLVIYCHAFAGKTTRRRDAGGLRRLQQILAHPSSNEPVAIHLLSFMPFSSLGRYSYLNNTPAVRFSWLPEKVSETKDQLSLSEGWRRLTRIASEEELEITCASYRHSLQSLTAAARIYLGAGIVGHVNEKGCEEVLTRLQGLAQVEEPSLQYNAPELVRVLRLHQRFRDDYRSITKPRGIRLWVLDDNWEEHGWSIVFNDLFSGSVRGFLEWDHLETELEANRERPTVLMVDCNLGSGGGIPTGLELLRAIRSRWQEVRVIFATAYDDAALALTSLREGANVFFAKALHDTGDRRSLDYYEHLLKLLRPHPIERDVSALWRSFVEGTGSTTTQNLGTTLPTPPATLTKMLRLGFYLLFSRIDDDLWWRGREWKKTDESTLYRAVINLIRAGFPDIKDYLRTLPPGISKVLKGGPHGGAPVTFPELRSVLAFLLDELGLRCGQPPIKSWLRPWPDHWPYRSSAQLQTDSSYPGLPADIPLAAHEVADGQGAQELARGRYCTTKCKHRFSSILEILTSHNSLNNAQGDYRDVVFLDDRGESSGWFKVMGAIFPGSRAFNNVDDFLREHGTVNVLFLDLRLPSLAAGREALRKILKWDASVPIVTMSAGHDSIAAIRSLRDGAIDFVSKTLPGPRDLDGCFLFADELGTKGELVREYGHSDCRRNWQRLQGLRRGIRWMTDEALVNAREKVSECRDVFDRITAGSQSTELLIPPSPDVWAETLADEIAVILRLQQQMFWLHKKKALRPNPQRLNYRREYHIQPVDYWRWEHVIASTKTAHLIKLTAVLAGVVVDRLAQWNWCMTNLQPLNPYLWGATSHNRIVIQNEVDNINGRFAWDRRKEALVAQSSKTPWVASLCDDLIRSVYTAVATFYSLHGAYPS